MFYQQFLPDGAIHINLGEPWRRRGAVRFDYLGEHCKRRVPQYMEEQMAEGAPYIRALYYWPSSGQKYMEWDRLVDLVSEARRLAVSGFDIPVPIGANLSPVAHVMKAFYYLTED